MQMKHLTFFVLIFFVLSSCGPASKLRRAQRLENEAIAAGAKIKYDTVFTDVFHPGEKTTVYLPGTVRDTTITIYQDKIKIQYVHRHDTVRVYVECPPDTIKVPITIHKSIICPPPNHTWRTLTLFLAGVLILFVVIVTLRK